jgi:phosphate starvation-inducible PhoH-like protein
MPTLTEARAARAERQKKESKQLTAQTPNQCLYLTELRSREQVFGVGPAGTGKTYLAARHALQQVLAGRKKRLVIARPTVARKRHQIGFLPGSADEKLGPWLVPVLDSLADECGVAVVERMRKDGAITFLSFEHMRGRTLKDAVVILDEAQNCSYGDLRTFLTRTGENAQVLVNGDTDQCDIDDSGLADVLALIERHAVDAAVIRFTDDDVVRSEIARQWVRAFRA